MRAKSKNRNFAATIVISEAGSGERGYGRNCKLLLARKKVPMVSKWIKDLLEG